VSAALLIAVNSHPFYQPEVAKPFRSGRWLPYAFTNRVFKRGLNSAGLRNFFRNHRSLDFGDPDTTLPPPPPLQQLQEENQELSDLSTQGEKEKVAEDPRYEHIRMIEGQLVSILSQLSQIYEEESTANKGFLRL